MARRRRPETTDPLDAGPIKIRGASAGAEAGARLADSRKQSEVRTALTALAIAGVPREQMLKVAEEQFGIVDEAKFDALLKRALDDHKRERESMKEYNKAHAEQRLLKTIARGNELGQLNAVVKAEEVLAEIQGTKELRPNVDVQVAISANLLAVMNGLTEDQVKKMVAEQARRLGVSNPLLPPPRPELAQRSTPFSVETTGTPADEF